MQTEIYIGIFIAVYQRSDCVRDEGGVKRKIEIGHSTAVDSGLSTKDKFHLKSIPEVFRIRGQVSTIPTTSYSPNQTKPELKLKSLRQCDSSPLPGQVSLALTLLQ